MCVNCDLHHFLKTAAHALDKDGVMQGELSYKVVQELHKYCSEPKPDLRSYPEDKEEVEAVIDLLKALDPLGKAAVDNLALPPPTPPTLAAQDYIVLGIEHARVLDGIYNRAHTPTIALQHMCEAGYIVYLMYLRC